MCLFNGFSQRLSLSGISIGKLAFFVLLFSFTVAFYIFKAHIAYTILPFILILSVSTFLPCKIWQNPIYAPPSSSPPKKKKKKKSFWEVTHIYRRKNFFIQILP